jgi:hypothetical protein
MPLRWRMTPAMGLSPWCKSGEIGALDIPLANDRGGRIGEDRPEVDHPCLAHSCLRGCLRPGHLANSDFLAATASAARCSAKRWCCMITRRHQEKHPERPLCSSGVSRADRRRTRVRRYRYSRHLPVVAAPIRCAQSLLVDFSVEQTRDALHDIDAAWFLVARRSRR